MTQRKRIPLLGVGISCSFIIASLGPLTSCKSRYEFTNKDKAGANNAEEEAVPFEPSDSTNGGSNGGTDGNGSTSTPNGDRTDSDGGGGTNGDGSSGTGNGGTGTGGTGNGGNGTNSGDSTATQTGSHPVGDVEVLQNSVSVTNIVVGIPVLLRPTIGTRDLDNSPGCVNPGILKAVWRTRTQNIATIQRTSASDCRALSTAGQFTRAGTVTIYLDVTTDENETATFTKVYPVIVTNSGSSGSSGPTQK
ncbi:MAG: hypothetical protein NT027_09850 [Proteobacteria bacterium]|nr:hypothetical protein [Pseudomonadota bacterium]